MPNPKPRVQHDIIARILDILAECHVFGAHVHHLDAIGTANALEFAVEVGILQVIEHLLATGEEAHASVGNLDEIGVGNGLRFLLGLLGGLALLELIDELLHGRLGVLGLEKLKGAVLGEKLLVPVLDHGELFVVGHHVVTGYDGVELGALNQFDKLGSGKDRIGIEADVDVVGLAVEWLLVLTAADVETEGLHACEGNEGALAWADDDIVAVGGDEDVKGLRPGQQKRLTEVVAREADNDALLLF